MLSDRDLASRQEVRHLLGEARRAQSAMMELDQAAIDRIVEAMAEAGYRASADLGVLAHRETTYGRPEDKRIKNEFGSRTVAEAIRGMRTIGYLGGDEKTKVHEFAWPYGVIGAIVPTTNPTSTIMYKALIAVKAGNALVASPHPNAVDCTCRALEVMRVAAESAGLPRGALGCLSTVTLEGSEELMQHRETDLILATGGTGMVRAAYSSGKPAYGVGPGNVPVYVDRSADISTAAHRILIGKSFDWGTLCSSEQTVVADAPIAEQLKAALIAEGGYWMTPEQIKGVERALILPNGRVNPALVGHSPQAIAEAAGFTVDDRIRALIAPLSDIGKAHPLSLEKLSPVLAFVVREGWEAGCHTCIDLLNLGGRGHTLGIYCTDDKIIMEFGLKKPVFRICVNSPTSIGAVGVTTGLFPAMTLGCGAPGGNITSDNIGPQHLFNKKRLAHHTRDYEPAPLGTPMRQMAGGGGGGPYSGPSATQRPYSTVIANPAPATTAMTGAGRLSPLACSPANPTGCDTASFHGLTESDIEAILAQMSGRK